MSKRVLGLDLGCSSIGWALLRVPESDAEAGEVTAMGVRVFPEGVDRDTKGLEKSKCVQRREARGARRIKQRRRLRRKQLVEILRQTGLLPGDDAALRELLTRDPYPLRAKGLDNKLERFELGRVLYHINQRRGFKSNRKGGKEKEGLVKKETSELQARIDGSQCRTLGEYLSKLAAKPGERPGPERVRDRYTLRAMYEDEFEKLWNAQQAHHAQILTPALRHELEDNIIFFQRPLRSSQHLVGYCELEPDEQRCPRDLWEAQQFVMLQELNHLLCIDTATGEEEGLSADDRAKLLFKLAWNKELEIKKAYDLLDWPDHCHFNFELQSKRTRLKGNAIGDAIRKAVGEKAAQGLPRERLIEIGAAMSDIEDDALLKDTATQKLGFTEAEAEKLVKAAGGLPEKHLMVSLKAIEKMLPYLEAACIISVAKEKAGYKRRDQQEPQDAPCLPLPWDTKRNTPLTNNPVVQKALFEVRKVVNAILNTYGKPDEIVIEMAREMRGSIAERNERNIEMRKREATRRGWGELLRKEYAEFKDHNPKRDDILKYELWLESKYVCPYTGQPISAAQLFSGEVQIEHILPYSLSLDDSFMNKTLCFADFNRKKGNRTPYEYFLQASAPGEQKRWEEIQIWVKNEKAIPWPKRRKFIQKEIDTDECIKRQLNDTRFINRLVRDFLLPLCPKGKLPDQYVRCSRGDLTAKLRWDWGLESVLDTEAKNREDHRHHAVDAVVIALTDRKRLLRLTAQDEARRARGLNIRGREGVPPPWVHLREEVKAKVKSVIVSHKPTRKVSGALHEEFYYGRDNKAKAFVRRKYLHELTGKMVANIRDKTIRELVQSRCTKGAKGKWVVPEDAFKAPLLMPSGVPVKKVRVNFPGEETRYRELRPATFVKTGSNHLVAIYAKPKGAEGVQFIEEVVPLFDALQRVRSGDPEFPRTPTDEPTAVFLFSLHKNDMLECSMADGAKSYWRVQKIAPGNMWIRPHTFAGKPDEDETYEQLTPAHLPTTAYRKITVDPLGSPQPALRKVSLWGRELWVEGRGYAHA